MAPTSTVVLEVASGKAQELTEALSKRDYINVVVLDREEKKRRKTCPCCGHKFPREVVYTVTSVLLEALLDVLYKMRISKSVVLVNKDNPLDRLPEYERPRCVEMSTSLIQKGMALGLLGSFQDGSRLTHFVTGVAIAFLVNKEPLFPSVVIVSQGEIVEKTGAMMVEDVKFKDRVRHDRFLTEAKRAIAELPRDVVVFVEKGQMSLV